jgi:hypothetical protein
MKLHLVMAVFCAACCTLLTTAGLAQQPQQPASAAENSLKGFLQGYLSDVPVDEKRTARYFSAFVDLNGDGSKEAIVYLTGHGWCGSSGCTTLILAPKGASYRLVTSITITWPPIRILTSNTNGWHDISVWVQGGGIQPGYEAGLSFDGKTYPSNPSVPPARRMPTKVAGEVVVPTTEVGIQIYR